MTHPRTLLEEVQKALGPTSRARVLYAGEDHVAGLVGPSLVLIARREPDESIVQEAPRWIDQMLASQRQKKGVCLVVVQASAPPPSEAARPRIDRVHAEYGRGVVAGAMVIEGSGFVAASIRSALSLMMLRSKYGYPLKTFATVGDGAAYVCGKLAPEQALKPSELTLGVEELRRAYESCVGAITAKSSRAG